jgi:predicted metal-dependent HD superfamily phosphohydrolase
MSTDPDLLDELSRSWDDLMDACGVSGESRAATFAQLVTAYSEPHRHYHNLVHIGRMLSKLQNARGWSDFEPLLLAAWYHDVVYDPRSSENESRSAEVARKSLKELGLSEPQIDRVANLILMTKTHQAPNDDLLAQFFLDADLSILASPSIEYAAYAAAIRKEYSWIPDREFYQGRQKILRDFLQRSRLFHVDFIVDNFLARENITSEIAEIDEKLKHL